MSPERKIIIPEPVKLYYGIKARAYHENQTEENRLARDKAKNILEQFKQGSGDYSIISQLIAEMPQYYPPPNKK